MNRYQAAKMPAHFSGYKHLTVDDILPDTTTKLYRRLFAARRKKYIPVKDISEDKAGRELNAYLIHPDYIDKSVIPGEEIAERLEAKPAVRVIQYSAISRLRPTYHEIRPVLSTNIITNLTGAIIRLKGRVLHFSRQAVNAVRTTQVHFPIGKVYSVSAGLTPKWRRHLGVKAGALALLMSVGTVAYIANNDGQEPQAQPTSSAGSHSQTRTLPSTTPSQPSASSTDQRSNSSGPTTSPTYTPQSTLSHMPTSANRAPTNETSTPASTSLQVTQPSPTPTLQDHPSTQPEPIAPPATDNGGLLDGGVVTDVTDTVTDTIGGLGD